MFFVCIEIWVCKQMMMLKTSCNILSADMRDHCTKINVLLYRSTNTHIQGFDLMCNIILNQLCTLDFLSPKVCKGNTILSIFLYSLSTFLILIK